ncbi:MAG: hypothetical protein O9266_03295 [Porphyrobacter sp.]|jgi:hypothetical protein|nr:hypothetical protein [Porphyrobacter sp.]
MRRTAILLLPVLLAAACSGAPDEGAQGDPFVSDPLVAAALHDPLMSDPDLSARNEANAVLGFAADTALPLLPATPEAAQAAREAGRLDLLSEGAIPSLPSPVAAPFALPAPGGRAQDGLAAIGASRACNAGLEEGFGWAAKLPQVAAIMPQGMVVQAGGSDAAGCGLRVIRYHTAAPGEDVLQYHYVRAGRAGLEPQRHSGEGESITASGPSGEALLVTLRKAANGLTAVDLYYRAS